MSENPPPFSSTTIALMLVFAVIVVVLLIPFMTIAVHTTTYIEDNITANLAKLSNNSINTVTYDNMTVMYVNSSYNSAGTFLSSVYLFFASIIGNPIGFGVLIGISVVVFSVFVTKRNT